MYINCAVKLHLDRFSKTASRLMTIPVESWPWDATHGRHVPLINLSTNVDLGNRALFAICRPNCRNTQS